jgi:hypothetical protein
MKVAILLSVAVHQGSNSGVELKFMRGLEAEFIQPTKE